MWLIGLVFCVVVTFFAVGSYDCAIRNDFKGNITIITEGEFKRSSECWDCEYSIGNYVIPDNFFFYKVLANGQIDSGHHVYLTDGLLKMGTYYRIYKKEFVMPFIFYHNSYFVECIKGRSE